jgi:transposase
MATFGTAQRLAAWAGVCPASHESAGKRKQRCTRKGNTFLKAALVTAAMSASQAKGTYLRDKFFRLKVRMGTKKASMAIAHKILVAAFHMLQRGAVFADLGGDYLDRTNRHRSARHLVRRLTALGYDVTLPSTKITAVCATAMPYKTSRCSVKSRSTLSAAITPQRQV